VKPSLCETHSVRWNQIVHLASHCENICEHQGRGKAEELARSQVNLEELRIALRRGSSLVRRKALHLVTFFDLRSVVDDIAFVLENDESPVVRHEAAYFFGLLKCEGAVEHLIKALDCDPCDLVRHEAAEALGDLGNVNSLEALRRARQDHSEIVRETAEISIEQLMLETGPSSRTGIDPIELSGPRRE
jgi:HEAT repeat protein